MTNNNVTFDRGFWKFFGCFIGVVVLICFLPWVFTCGSFLNFTGTGQIGDTIGGIMGPFIAIAAAGLTFIAFWVQYKANIQQRHDIAIERFESNLFEMIHVQQEITSGLKVWGESMNGGFVERKDRDVFECLYKDIKMRIKIENATSNLTLRRALEISDDVKFTLRFQSELWVLDHYYRHLYRIFKYIDDADSLIIDDDKKYEYAAIVRATLSPYELVMIFYNGLLHRKFKTLIEKYAILNNLRYDILASKEDKGKYKALLRNDENCARTMEYSEGAFVHSREKGGVK